MRFAFGGNETSKGEGRPPEPLWLNLHSDGNPDRGFKEIVDALIKKKPITEGDICSYKETPTISPTYAKINSYKHNPNKPQGVNGVKRGLGDF